MSYIWNSQHRKTSSLLTKHWQGLKENQIQNKPFLVLNDALIYMLTILILFVSTSTKVKEGFLGSVNSHVLDNPEMTKCSNSIC